MAQITSPAQQIRGSRVRKLYEMINAAIQDPEEREKAYFDVSEMELKKLSKALETAISQKVSMLDTWQAMIETGELQEMLSTFFMTAKPEHRITISHLYDNLNHLFGIAQTELGERMAAQQTAQGTTK